MASRVLHWLLTDEVNFNRFGLPQRVRILLIDAS